MSRLVLSALAAAVATLSLAHWSLIVAAAGAPDHPVLAQKQLVSATDCQTAAQAKSRSDFVSKGAEYRDDVLITTRYCSATAHNQLTPTKPEIVVVSADPGSSGEVKIFFKTIPKDNAKKVHDTCVLAGRAAFAYAQASTAPPADSAIAGADVLTSSGKVGCDSFLSATAADNPLVVLAPGAFSGTVISVHILNMIGLKKPATEVQAAVDDLGHQVVGSVTQGADEVRKHPQIVLGSPGRN
jgi:hypothetical protein